MEKKEIKINMVTIFLVIMIIVLVLTIGYAFIKINNLDNEIAYSQQLNYEKDKQLSEVLSFKSENAVTTQTIELNKTIDELKEKVSSLEKQVEEKDKALEEVNKEKNAKTIGKIDEDEGLVYTIKREALTYAEKTTQIDIPQINLKCDNIIAFNKFLSDYNYKKGFYTVRYYIYDNIISIVIHWQSQGDSEWNKIYNINSENGQFITLNDLLFMRGISRDKFDENVSSGIEKIIETHLPDNFGVDENNKNMLYVCRDETHMLNSYRDIPVYINEKGVLCAELLYTAPAGSGGPWPEIIEIK